MFEVLYNIRGTWCMFIPWMVQDGLVHGKWPEMDWRAGDIMWWICTMEMACSVVAWPQVGACLALYARALELSCLLGVHHSKWPDGEVHSLEEQPTYEEEHCASWMRASSPTWHGVAWTFGWTLGVGPRIPRLPQYSCRGSWSSGVHGLGGVMEYVWTWDGEVWTHLE
jgi:hypothetical protein